MKASELIVLLEDMVATYGDLHVVSGVNRSGYGEAVDDVVMIEGCTIDNLGVVDLVLSDESMVTPHN